MFWVVPSYFFVEPLNFKTGQIRFWPILVFKMAPNTFSHFYCFITSCNLQLGFIIAFKSAMRPWLSMDPLPQSWTIFCYLSYLKNLQILDILT